MIRQKFDIGDLVEVDVPYSEENSKLLGLVVKTKLINPQTNTSEQKWHDDEYTCMIKVLKAPDPEASKETQWIRAKWLKQIAKVKFSS